MRHPVHQEQDGGSVHTSLYIRDTRFDTRESMAASTVTALPPSYDDIPPRDRRREHILPPYDSLFLEECSHNYKQPPALDIQ